MSKQTKTIIKKSKKVYNRFKSFVINKKEPSYYAQTGRRMLNENKEEEAKQLWNKGLEFYPNSLLIHREYALYSMNQANWKNAAHHWEAVFKSKNKHLLKKSDFLNASKTYKECHEYKRSIRVLKLSFSQIRADREMISALADSFMYAGKWEEAIEQFFTLFKIANKPVSESVYLGLAKAYRELSYPSQSEYILREGVKVYPKSKLIMANYAQSALDRKEWDLAIVRYEYLIKLYREQTGEPPAHCLLTLSMLYQVTGKTKKAKDYLDDILTIYPEEVNENKQTYHKMRLFENEGSTIDLYKKYNDNQKVIITFDSLNMDWNEPPFGFKLLLRQNVDIVAVRQKWKKSYQQYLSQEEFKQTLEKLVNGYPDKIAYGHSQGGYTSLYFASNLNCRILSLAPRISIHPIYGKESTAQKHHFQHNLEHNYNDKISPIIVYDPKSKRDNRYVNESLLRSYPNAIIIKLPYGGHGIARHLLRMGVLKDYVLDVIDDKVPKYDRSLKKKSGNYCRLLGQECLKRGKLKWAKALSDRALELLPNERFTIRLRVDVLKALGQYDEALKYIQKKVKHKPKSLYTRLVLIDLYIFLEELINAEREVTIALKSFKSTEQLYKRKKMVDNIRDKIINEPLDIFKG